MVKIHHWVLPYTVINLFIICLQVKKKKRESNLRLFKIVWGCKWTSSFDLAYLPITQIYNTDVEEQIKNIKKTVHPQKDRNIVNKHRKLTVKGNTLSLIHNLQKCLLKVIITNLSLVHQTCRRI